MDRQYRSLALIMCGAVVRNLWQMGRHSEVQEALLPGGCDVPYGGGRPFVNGQMGILKVRLPQWAEHW